MLIIRLQFVSLVLIVNNWYLYIIGYVLISEGYLLGKYAQPTRLMNPISHAELVSASYLYRYFNQNKLKLFIE